MSASIVLKIRLGPLVYFEVEGDNCTEISEALQGYQTLNQQINDMCSDLAERVYPDGIVPEETAMEGEDDEI